MTAIRKRNKTDYHAFLVEPTEDFCPSNWQQKPESYRIIKYLGPRNRLGQRRRVAVHAQSRRHPARHGGRRLGDLRSIAPFCSGRGYESRQGFQLDFLPKMDSWPRPLRQSCYRNPMVD